MFDAVRASCGGTPCVIGVANPAERYREDRSVRVHDTPFEKRCAAQTLAIYGLSMTSLRAWAVAEVYVNVPCIRSEHRFIWQEFWVDMTFRRAM